MRSRDSYATDLVLVDPDKPHTAIRSEMLPKCAG
jgi:hypothetical protein